MRSGTGSAPAVAVVFSVCGIASASSFARNPSIRDLVGATPQTLSLALVCVGIGSVSTMPFTGRWVDRWSSTPVIRVAAAVTALSWMGVAFAPNIWMLALVMLVAGAGTGVWDVAMNIQGTTVEQRQNRVHMPMLHAVFSFGSVGGALLGALFARLGIPITVQFPLVWGLALITVVIATTQFIDDRQVATDAIQAGPATVQTEPATRAPRAKIGRVEILIGVMMACTALGEGAANDWLGITMVDTRGVAEAVGALALGGFNLTMAIARIVGGKLIAKYGRVPVLRISGLTATIGVLMLALVNSPVVAVIGAALWGLGLAVVFPSGISAAGDLGERGNRSISFVATLGYTGFLLGAPLIGQLTHFMPIDKALLAVAAATSVIIFVAPITREKTPVKRPLDGGPGEELIHSV